MNEPPLLTSALPPNPIPLGRDPESLPFRLRQSTFRLYESFIASALRQWPEPVTINPAPLRATTVAARLRDAIFSLHRYRWETMIDMEQFDAVYAAKTLVVSHRDFTVTIGPRARGKSKGVAADKPTQDKSALLFEEGKWTDADVLNAVSLLSRKLLPSPIHIKPTISQALADELEARFDVAVQQQEDRTIII